jgi:hypothetical protein
MIGALAVARTFLANFPGPVAVVAVVGLVVGAGVGWGVSKAFYGASVARAEGRTAAALADLERYRGEVARAAAEVAQRARDKEREAYERRIAERDAVVQAINDGFRRIAGEERVTREKLRQELAAPEWACLRNPLPDDVIERLLEQANGP